VLIVQLEIPQIPHNLFSPSSRIRQLFGISMKKAIITCPLSMVRTIVFPQIVSMLEWFPYLKFSFLGKKLKFAATIQIFYNLQIQEQFPWKYGIYSELRHSFSPQISLAHNQTSPISIAVVYDK
jgi:hypothetical protein